ncbi:MarR family winged helix-turn-helix transcriptional regulator [Streptomyces canus]|uniref:MarR family winged helix-turn-helix transcriptional regulator n=1 Tax=Streptomyces canus TaxID=58343 RepID=UPI0036876D2E
MPAQDPGSAAGVSANVVEIEHVLSRMTYVAGRARQHERLMAAAGLDLDRAAVTILRNIAASDPVRPGVLAVRLSVEASHVTRQLRQLERIGYVVRVADPDDRRAQLVQLTDAGLAAVERIREVSRRGVELALADWTPDELERFAMLFRRLVHAFVAHTETPLDLPAEASAGRRPRVSSGVNTQARSDSSPP